MNIQDTLIIASEFAEDPGAREIADGENSGERFYHELLEPRFKKAIEGNYILLVDLDGVYGYPSSFVSGSFGKLSSEYGAANVLNHIKFRSKRRPIRIDKIEYEIQNPAPRKY